jgi:hypothetical protein
VDYREIADCIGCRDLVVVLVDSAGDVMWPRFKDEDRGIQERNDSGRDSPFEQDERKGNRE